MKKVQLAGFFYGPSGSRSRYCYCFSWFAAAHDRFELMQATGSGGRGQQRELALVSAIDPGNRNAGGDLNHANVRRTAAVGGANRGTIDSDDSEVVELYRRHLFDRHRHFGTGANVRKYLTAQTRRRSSKLKKAKTNFAERRTCRC